MLVYLKCATLCHFYRLDEKLNQLSPCAVFSDIVDKSKHLKKRSIAGASLQHRFSKNYSRLVLLWRNCYDTIWWNRVAMQKRKPIACRIELQMLRTTAKHPFFYCERERKRFYANLYLIILLIHFFRSWKKRKATDITKNAILFRISLHKKKKMTKTNAASIYRLWTAGLNNNAKNGVATETHMWTMVARCSQHVAHWIKLKI